LDGSLVALHLDLTVLSNALLSNTAHAGDACGHITCCTRDVLGL
jgi:hypothetical protein